MTNHEVIKTLLKRFITGITVPQQYVCIARDGLASPLSVWATGRKGLFLDVSDTHLFLGYKPVVIGLIFHAGFDYFRSDKIALHFQSGAFVIDDSWKGLPANKRSVARLLLEKCGEQKRGAETVLLYRAIDVTHSLIDRSHQFINNSMQALQPKKQNNIDLPGKNHDMVRVAYSVPRTISLITLADAEKMNMFPTDLHGAVSNEFYMSSLRIGGKANEQVQRLKKVVVSTVCADGYKFVYALGKNHMQDMKPRDQFSTSSRVTQVFQLPLPAHAIHYHELELLDSFDVGIHRIHTYKTLHEEKVTNASTLAHIHQYYAQWRQNRGLVTNMLLR